MDIDLDLESQLNLDNLIGYLILRASKDETSKEI